MSDELIAIGASVEQIAAAASVSHLTVRMWLKSIKDVHVPAAAEDDAAEELKASTRTNEGHEDKSTTVDTRTPKGTAAAESAEKAAARTPKEEEAVETRESEVTAAAASSAPSQEVIATPGGPGGDWVKVRIAGQVLEISWDDLMRRQGNLPLLPEATKPRPRIKVDPKDDFNRMANEDCNMQDLLEKFEVSVLSNAIARHKTIGDISEALQIPRSTLDSKRRKFGLI